MGLVPAAFVATADFITGDIFSVDGVEYNAQMTGGESIPSNMFTTVSTMVVVLDTIEKKLTFKSSDTEGGGLGDDQLSLATATTDQVFLGQTFYAGDSTLKTGTFDLAAANATAAQVLSGRKFYAGNNKLKTGTLVAGGKTKSGTFKGFDADTLEIYCGFKPLIVVISTYSLDYIGDSLSYYFNGGSNGVYLQHYPFTEPEEISGQISVTSSGFVAHNVLTTDDEGIFVGDTITYEYYAAG